MDNLKTAKGVKKSIEQILKEQPEMYGRLLLRSTGGRLGTKTTLKGVFFTPFYISSDGIAHGLRRWYGGNNKEIVIDSVRADLKKWSFVRIVPIIPSNDSRRICLERQMRKLEYIEK